MEILNGVKNFLQFLHDNWTSVTVIIGLAVALYRKIKNWLALSEETKIAQAKAQLSTVILQMISKAETDWAEWEKTGSIKRSQVIAQIFKDYPILSKVTDQDELIAWIDGLINEALKEMREILRKKEEDEANG